jgi:hypothetical protein
MERRGSRGPESGRIRQPGLPQAQQQLPGRSYFAIKTKLMVIRREMGIPKRGKVQNLVDPGDYRGPTMLKPDDRGMMSPHWQEAQRPRLEQANQAYLGALLQMVA